MDHNMTAAEWLAVRSEYNSAHEQSNSKLALELDLSPESQTSDVSESDR